MGKSIIGIQTTHKSYIFNHTEPYMIPYYSVLSLEILVASDFDKVAGTAIY